MKTWMENGIVFHRNGTSDDQWFYIIYDRMSLRTISNKFRFSCKGFDDVATDCYREVIAKKININYILVNWRTLKLLYLPHFPKKLKSTKCLLLGKIKWLVWMIDWLIISIKYAAILLTTFFDFIILPAKTVRIDQKQSLLERE